MASSSRPSVTITSRSCAPGVRAGLLPTTYHAHQRGHSLRVVVARIGHRHQQTAPLDLEALEILPSSSIAVLAASYSNVATIIEKVRTVRGQSLHLKPRRLRPARVEGVQWRVTAERATTVPRRQS
eukprot:scaffold65608_cov71-Phaeocystis_antarctica.AAC.7